MGRKHLCAALVAVIMILGSLSVVVIANNDGNNDGVEIEDALVIEDSPINATYSSVTDIASNNSNIGSRLLDDAIISARCAVNICDEFKSNKDCYDIDAWAGGLYVIAKNQKEVGEMYAKVVENDGYGDHYVVKLMADCLEEIQKSYDDSVILIRDNFDKIVDDATSKCKDLMRKADSICTEYSKDMSDGDLIEMIHDLENLNMEFRFIESEVDALFNAVALVSTDDGPLMIWQDFKDDIANGLGDSYDAVVDLAKERGLVS